MQLAWFIIDDGGKLWEATSYRLRADLHALATGSLFNDYVVKNLGFVRLAKQPRSASIRLRPETVSHMAWVRLLSWLTDEQPERVLISTYADGQWNNALLSDNAQTLSLIASHMRGPRSEAASYDALRHYAPASVRVAVDLPARFANEV